MDGSVDFNREWEDYKNSFGSSDGEFWAGSKVPLLSFYSYDFIRNIKYHP